jgi:hypothetical protein
MRTGGRRWYGSLPIFGALAARGVRPRTFGLPHKGGARDI